MAVLAHTVPLYILYYDPYERVRFITRSLSGIIPVMKRRNSSIARALQVLTQFLMLLQELPSIPAPSKTAGHGGKHPYRLIFR